METLLPYDALAHFLNIKILKTADSSFNVHLYCLSFFFRELEASIAAYTY